MHTKYLAKTLVKYWINGKKKHPLDYNKIADILADKRRTNHANTSNLSKIVNVRSSAHLELASWKNYCDEKCAKWSKSLKMKKNPKIDEKFEKWWKIGKIMKNQKNHENDEN